VAGEVTRADKRLKQADQNSASAIARAFATYALVPYLGILFCPGAVVMGGVGLMRYYREPQIGGRAGSYLSIIAGSLVLGLQLFLWWILNKVPEWARGF
jgi:hypothetical protein